MCYFVKRRSVLEGHRVYSGLGDVQLSRREAHEMENTLVRTMHEANADCDMFFQSRPQVETIIEQVVPNSSYHCECAVPALRAPGPIVAVSLGQQDVGQSPNQLAPFTLHGGNGWSARLVLGLRFEQLASTLHRQ